MIKSRKKQKVLMALSGGVDSSVAAKLLIEDGFEVVGAYMKQWTEVSSGGSGCTWRDDRRFALAAAARLGIPFLTLDFEKQYRELVIKYMYGEYEKGLTPNPDILCNKFLKFGLWLDYATRAGFDFLATGHYARVAHSEIGYHLLEAKDKNKDQSYFLHSLGQKELARVLFPLGALTKVKVRELARKYNLPAAERAESMGICFVGEVPMRDFLKDKIKAKSGDVLMTDGRVVGRHAGLPFYTIGQRHGFDQAGGTESLYVVAKNQEKNQLIVGSKDDPLLQTKRARVIGEHWVGGARPTLPFDCEVRLRHRQDRQKVRLAAGEIDGDLILQFEQKQRAVTPGQFAVFYLDEECLGGAVLSA